MQKRKSLSKSCLSQQIIFKNFLEKLEIGICGQFYKITILSFVQKLRSN